MRRLNIVVSDEAKEYLDEYRDANGFGSLDTAADNLLLSQKRNEEK